MTSRGRVFYKHEPMCSLRRQLRWTLPLLMLGAVGCGPRPITGSKGCQRQVDCLGREVCDPRTHECVSESSVDAGPCAGTLAGCADDGLNNRAPQCAAPVPGGGKYFAGLLMCPAITDYFGVEAQQGWPLQVMAWPSLQKDFSLTLTGPAGATVASESTVNTSFAHLAVTSLPAGAHVLGVVAQENAAYDLQVLSGTPCVTDSSCPSVRCEPLMPDPYNTSATVPAEELTRGGVCVGTDAGPCGDPVTEPNTRTTSFAISNGSRTPFQTCLRDVDWGHFDLPGTADTVQVQLTCTTSDPLYLPHVMIVGPANDVEWAAVLQDARAPSNSSTNIPYLQAGTHALRLAQVAGREGTGACTLIVSWVAAACTVDGDCTGVAARFGRTHCTGGACVR
jgi:hypothetical protein